MINKECSYSLYVRRDLSRVRACRKLTISFSFLKTPLLFKKAEISLPERAFLFEDSMRLKAIYGANPAISSKFFLKEFICIKSYFKIKIKDAIIKKECLTYRCLSAIALRRLAISS